MIGKGGIFGLAYRLIINNDVALPTPKRLREIDS
jgi:hypothetical protein